MRCFPVLLLAILLAACSTFDAPPTLAPTRELSGPTVQPSDVFRGEFPTDAPQFQGQNDPTAAAAVSGGDLPPVALDTPVDGQIRHAIQITASDGRLLSGDLYTGGGPRVPGVLMLAPDSSQWLDLPL